MAAPWVTSVKKMNFYSIYKEILERKGGGLTLRRRAKDRNVSFLISSYVGQFTLSTQLITPNYLVPPLHQRSTIVSLKNYPFLHCMLIHLEIIILIISSAKIDPLAQARRLTFGLDRAYTFL